MTTVRILNVWFTKFKGHLMRRGSMDDVNKHPPSAIPGVPLKSGYGNLDKKEAKEV